MADETPEGWFEIREMHHGPDEDPPVIMFSIDARGCLDFRTRVSPEETLACVQWLAAHLREQYPQMVDAEKVKQARIAADRERAAGLN